MELTITSDTSINIINTIQTLTLMVIDLGTSNTITRQNILKVPYILIANSLPNKKLTVHRKKSRTPPKANR